MQFVHSPTRAAPGSGAAPPRRRRSPSAVPRRALLALLAGFALFAGHPPLDWEWVGVVALAPLIALARDLRDAPRPLRAGAGWGLLAGAALFVPLLEWVRLVDWLGLVLLVAIQAAFVGVYVAGLAWWGRRPGWPVIAALWWVGLEALRGAAPFGGFPWGVLGYTQHDGPFLAVARTLGVLGVSLVLAGLAAALEAVLHRLALRDGRGGVLTPLGAGAAVAAAGLLVTVVPAPEANGDLVDVAGVQGFDVEGSTGRSLPRALVMAEGHLELTEALAASPAGPPDLVIWPENALDSQPAGVPELADAVDRALDAAAGAPLITGMITDGPEPDTWQNTMAVFDEDPVAPRDVYAKRRPVPFGEYIPFRSLIDWYPPIRRMRPTDAVAGTESSVLDAGVDGVRVGAVICYESVFPRLVHSQVAEGANLLVVATNNSSFGRGAMSDQHLAFSSLRAVEAGRWVVHAALTGTSAIVDPDGGVHQETELFEQAIVRAEVPLVEARPLGSYVGDGVGWAALALCLAGFAAAAWRRRGQPPRTDPVGPAPVSGRGAAPVSGG